MKLAGGMFGFDGDLSYVQTHEPKFMSEPRLLFLNARCAIQFLLNKLNPPQVWMPSYLCCSMIDAVDQRVTKLNFFPIGSELEILSLDWLNLLIPGSLVVLIDYFGFPCNRQVITEVQSRGSFVIEDASHALLSPHVGLQSDFVLFSPRKTVGVPDGGILQYKHNHLFSSIELLPPPREWWLKAIDACIVRREFDKFGGERKWYELFRQVEETYPLGAYRMSELSEFLLDTAFDYQAIAEARRANYAYLAGQLPEYALIKKLDDNTVPLGFPLIIHKRDEIRQILFDHMIYPPIHWDISECVPGSFVASHELSKNIMTIPCDHRLKRDDVIHIAEILIDALGKK